MLRCPCCKISDFLSSDEPNPTPILFVKMWTNRASLRKGFESVVYVIAVLYMYLCFWSLLDKILYLLCIPGALSPCLALYDGLEVKHIEQDVIG